MLRKLLHGRIARRLILAIVIFSTLITVLTTAIQLAHDYRRDLAHINQSLQLVELAQLGILSNSLWVEDWKQVNIQLDGMLQQQDMEYLALHVEGAVVAHVGKRASRYTQSRRLTVTYSYNNQWLSIGELEIVASIDNVLWRLVDKTVVILITNAFKTFLVALFVLFIVYQWVTRHLERIVEYAQQLDMNHPVPELALIHPTPDDPLRDELDELISALNNMQQQLHDSFANIQRSEFNFRTLVESTNTVPWRLGLNSQQFIYMGAQIEGLLGYPTASWKAFDDWAQRIHPDERDTIVNLCLAETASGRGHEMEYRMLHQDGSIVWVRDVVAVHCNREGRPFELSGFFIDITQRARLEQELKQTLKGLDQKVIEQTQELRTQMAELELTRNELIQNEKMASLGRMVAGFAHEINTPLGIGVSAASLIEELHIKIVKMLEQDEVEEDELRSVLAKIGEAGTLTLRNLQRAADLVSRFKRISVDQSRSKERDFNLNQTISDLLSTLTPEFTQHDINITTEGDPELTLYGDPGLIAQLITNLVLNCRQHAFDAETQNGKIEVSFGSTSDEFWINVTDNGQGMEANTVEKVFEPFFTTARGSRGGTGLGLFICYNIVTNEMNGTIECHSQQGIGTRFHIAVPLKKDNSTTTS